MKLNNTRGRAALMLWCLLSLQLFCHGSTGYWSGAIVLPDGTTAGSGDVTGYAAWAMNLSVVSDISGYDWYEYLQRGDWGHKETSLITKDAAYMSPQTSDSEGKIGFMSDWFDRGVSSGLTMLLVCKYDGYEYYKQVSGGIDENVYPKVYDNGNLAAKAEWRRGNPLATATPEPTSALLLIVGCAALALRRRRESTPSIYRYRQLMISNARKQSPLNPSARTRIRDRTRFCAIMD